MPALSDPERLRCCRNALGNWRFEGYVRFTELADRWVRKELAGCTTRDVACLMNDFVNGPSPGLIDEQRETRPEWSDHDYHYDLRFEIEGRRVYIEKTYARRRPHRGRRMPPPWHRPIPAHGHHE